MKIPQLVPQSPMTNDRLVAWFQFIIAETVLLLLVYIVYSLINSTIPPTNRETLNLILGTIAGSVGTALSFWLPSSVGSKVKDDNVAKALDATAKLTETVASAGTGSGAPPQPVVVTNDPANPVPTQDTPPA